MKFQLVFLPDRTALPKDVAALAVADARITLAADPTACNKVLAPVLPPTHIYALAVDLIDKVVAYATAWRTSRPDMRQPSISLILVIRGDDEVSALHKVLTQGHHWGVTSLMAIVVDSVTSPRAVRQVFSPIIRSNITPGSTTVAVSLPPHPRRRRFIVDFVGAAIPKPVEAQHHLVRRLSGMGPSASVAVFSLLDQDDKRKEARVKVTGAKSQPAPEQRQRGAAAAPPSAATTTAPPCNPYNKIVIK